MPHNLLGNLRQSYFIWMANETPSLSAWTELVGENTKLGNSCLNESPSRIITCESCPTTPQNWEIVIAIVP
jgi:hypothetical protein